MLVPKCNEVSTEIVKNNIKYIKNLQSHYRKNEKDIIIGSYNNPEIERYKRILLVTLLEAIAKYLYPKESIQGEKIKGNCVRDVIK